MATIVEVLREAELVKADEALGCEFVLVWCGGVTVNTWAEMEKGEWKNTDSFSVSDDRGRPVEREEMKQHMEMYAENVKASIRGEER
jgi:hypothetical protein